MIKRLLNKKYLKVYILLLLLLATLVSIYYIDLSIFNSKLIKYDEKYLLKITYLVGDKNKLDDDATVAYTTSLADPTVILYSATQDIPLIKDGDYLYADLNNFTNKKLLDRVSDVLYAKNNLDGEIIEGCSYDKETRILRIPFSYYEGLKEDDNPIPIQVEIESLMTSKEIRNLETDYSIKKLITYNNKAKNSLLQLNTKISISNYVNGNLAKDNIHIYVNNSITEVDQNSFNYDDKTKVITIDIPSILINNVNIRFGNNIIKNVFAVSATQIPDSNSYKLNSRPSALISLGSNHAYYTTELTHSEGLSGDRFIYCHTGSTHSYCKQTVSGATADPDLFPTDLNRRYHWNGSTYVLRGESGDLFPYIIKNSYLAYGATHDSGATSNTYLDFEDPTDYVLLRCAHVAEGINTPSDSMGLQLQVYIADDGLHPEDNYLVLGVKTYSPHNQESLNGWGGQYGTAWIRVYWDDAAETCNLNVTKRVVKNVPESITARTIIEAVPASLWNQSVVDSKSARLNLANSGDNTATVTLNGLTIGTTYNIREYSFVNPNNNDEDLLAHKFTNTTGTVSVTPSAKDPDTGLCTETATIINTQRNYCFALKKVSASDGTTPVSGAEFKMVGADGHTVTATTNSSGIATFTNLVYQDYTLTETSVNNQNPMDLNNDGTLDYWNDNSTGITVYADGTGHGQDAQVLTEGSSCSTPTKTITDNKVYYCIKIKKQDYDTGAPLAGATFTASKTGTIVHLIDTSDSNDPNHSYDTTNGIISFFVGDSSTATGWTITETGAPTNYSISTSSKTVDAIALDEANSESAARAACLSSGAMSSDKTTTVADLTYNNGTLDYVFRDQLQLELINWYKTSEDGTTLSDGAEFKVKDSSNNYITVSNPVSVTDNNNVTKSCYEYTGTSSTGTVMTSTSGEVCINGLPNDTYTVTETSPLHYHTFDSVTSINITSGHNFVPMTNSNKFINRPTSFEFTKTVSTGDGNTTLDVTLPNNTSGTTSLTDLTTLELQKLKFVVTEASSNTPLEFIYTNGHYEYVGNSIDAPTGTSTTILQLNSNRKINITHLDWGKTYQIKEVATDGCTDADDRTCEGYGFYYPNYTNSSDYEFQVSNAYNSTTDKSLQNTPTEITFTKSDFYGYYNESDVVKFENDEEVSAFDQITFKLKDANGNYLTLQEVGNTGNCKTSNSYAEYRYVPSDNSDGSSGTSLHTCGGKIKITHLCRGTKYYIEETSVPSNTVFVLPTPHLQVEYNIPTTSSAITSTSNTQTISDVPTRIVFEKLDERTSTKINDETTTFKIYQCKSNVSTCTSSNGRLMKFAARSEIQGDLEDSGKEVYRYKEGQTVENLHPYKGQLILRYLPAGYKYVAVETNAPEVYYQPSSATNTTAGVVSSTSTNNVVTVVNSYTRIYLQKDDVYKYYSKTDKAKLNSNDNLLDTVKFVLRDKDGNKVLLKKVQDGEYRYSPVTSDNTVEKISTYNGELKITHLKRGEKYYIEEVETDEEGNLVLPTNVTRPSGIPNGWAWKGHPYVEYTIGNTIPASQADVTQIIENSPTRVIFKKLDKKTGEVITDESITFNVYRCAKSVTTCSSSNGELVNFDARGTITGDQEDSGKEVYKYNKLNNTGVTDLHPYNGELILRYLPSTYKYVLVETVAGSGYYQPENNEEISFTVKGTTIDESQYYEILTSNVENTPTEITFTKNDLYGYATSSSVVKFEDEQERSAFDEITFKLKDVNGNYLTLQKVGNTGNCKNDNSYSEYKYTPLGNSSNGTELHTCGGKIKITQLYRGTKYYIEETSVPSNTVFVLSTPHPEVEYNIPAKESAITSTSNSQTISDVPTRIVINKKDNRSSADIHESTNKKETAQFEVYRCTNTSVACTKATSTGTKVKFTNIANVNNEQTYRYALNQSSTSNTVTTLNLTTVGNKGQLVLSYLPANYRYVVVEKNAPDGYYNLEGDLADLDVTVSTSSTANTYNRANYPTMIKFKKDDIYKYYTSTDLSQVNDNKIFDSMTFVLRDKNGSIVTLKQVQPGEYRFIQNDGTASSNNVTELHTSNGELLITHLYRNEKYYIEEIASDTLGNFILPTNVTKPSGIPNGWTWAGHPFVTYNIPEVLPANGTSSVPSSLTELIENKPTRVVFEKRNSATGALIEDSTTTFEVYACELSTSTCNITNGQKVYFEDRTVINGLTDDISSVTPPVLAYKYSKLNSNSGVSELHTDRGVLVLTYLPSTYKYVLYEKVAPNGYYTPSTLEAQTSFTVKGGTTQNVDYDVLTEVIQNTPSGIVFIKSDLYNYYSNEDKVRADSDERILDTAEFVIRDSQGRFLNIQKIGSNSADGNIYSYNTSSNNTRLNTYKGRLRITNLPLSSVYYIEEVKTTDSENFILPDNLSYENLPFDNNGHPVVKYTLTDSAPTDLSSITREIKNIPTRVRFEKRDTKYNYLIPDETTTFKVYQCNSNVECHPSDYSTDEERLNAGIKLINFSSRSLIQDDNEDDGVEVYRYSKLNTNAVTELHPDHGVLVLRYLPSDSNYTYVLYEVASPTKYLLPTGRDAETSFTVVSTTTSVEEVNIANSPTAVIIRKYADKDGDSQADSDKLLGGAKFKVYKVNNYDETKSLKDQDKELVKLKTIKEGIYENRPVLDSDVITTCSGDNCSYNPNSLGYDASIWENIDDLIDISGEDIRSVLTEGTALIEYLDYDTYYIIEEVEAPIGYSLPEEDDNRLTLVHINQNETQLFDTRDALINKPTSFTFYKFDEYNNPLDGATFYLQKLTEDKTYETLKVSKETLSDGSVIYRANKSSDLTDITTSSGHATVYYLEPGQYRILEVKASPGYELPKKTINVVTFFVDEDGLVYGNNIITNKKPSETIEYIASDQAELIINIQTGKIVVKYGLIIVGLIGAITGLIFLLRKRK